ncbi:hypothetical protein ACHAXT_007489 [Thalassiosira profunda]
MADAVVVLSLTGVRAELGPAALERRIAGVLSLPPPSVTVTIDDGNDATIVVYPEGDDVSLEADEVVAIINDAIQHGKVSEWTTDGAVCSVAEDEESASITEEEALEMWRDMSEEVRTGHLDKVPSPDGVMIQPSNEMRATNADKADGGALSPVESHLRRDPTLLEFDNVKRVDISQIDKMSWDEPVIIANAISEDVFAKREFLERHRLAAEYGDAEVRTGNRETLIDNGVTNSRPLPLSEALLPANDSNQAEECGTIVFSPVKELPDELARELLLLLKKQQLLFTDCFPTCPKAPMTKFTLTIASEGFGIGMHKHNAAMFQLLVGRKKWYMASSEDLGGDTDSHPGFYREKSTHKCIQRAGEVLFVPHDWYHEIFNLEYTVGIQALPG